MDTVLVVAGSQKSIDFLSQLMRSGESYSITSVSSGSEARRMTVQNEYDLVIINTPLSDEFGHDLAIKTSDMSSSGILLLVKNEIADDVTEKVEDYGIMVVSKPLSRPMFFQALKMITASHRRVAGLKKENTGLHNKIEEIRQVNRAKLLLIERLRISEGQAHRHIEKQAMDLRINRLEVANNIIELYSKR